MNIVWVPADGGAYTEGFPNSNKDGYNCQACALANYTGMPFREASKAIRKWVGKSRKGRAYHRAYTEAGLVVIDLDRVWGWHELWCTFDDCIVNAKLPDGRWHLTAVVNGKLLDWLDPRTHAPGEVWVEAARAKEKGWKISCYGGFASEEWDRDYDRLFKCTPDERIEQATKQKHKAKGD